jgi:aspartate carbamoyltransferase catalytic subunit
MLTIYQYKKTFTNLSVAIVGDIIHSRVAHSDIQALKTLGVNDIRLIAPPKLQYNGAISTSIKLFKDLKSGIKQCDVIITLRIQKERMLKANIPNEKNYFNDYGLTKEALKLAKKDVIIMHPGPVNRNIEIDSDIIDSDNCVILKQVTNGIAVRMAVMNILAKNIKNLSL